MQPLAASLTDKFLPVFRSLPDPVQLTGKTADALTIEQDGSVRVIRAPIGYVPPCPVIAIVGITPGRFQAEKALAAFRTALTCGRDIEAALQRAKGIAAFSGPLRANLVAMLDYIELHHALGVSSCADLFGAASDPVHFTSALPYPVFVGDANYSGMPDFLRFPMLRRWIETALAEEANALPSAVWVSLGPKPATALHHLAAQGIIDAKRILDSVPHPSGANAERTAFFLGRKPRSSLSRNTRPDEIEAAVVRLRARVKKLNFLKRSAILPKAILAVPTNLI